MTLERLGACLVARYRGEITLDVTGDIKRALDGSMADGQAESVALDLSEVPFMDSSGIGLLVSVNTRLRSAGKGFFLMSLSPQVRKTLALVQLLDFFEVVEDREALESHLA